MRIGEWVPVYKQWLPIPRRMAMAFALQNGSELYLARVSDTETPHRQPYEMIVSPVPAESWLSVCRLSVRLNDEPKALATATQFLRNKRINILLTECCTTYQNRAHWDAICDLGETEGFAAIRQQATRAVYESTMEDFLEGLTGELKTFADDENHEHAFFRRGDRDIEFSPLTGLNDAHFICGADTVARLTHQAGAIRLPDSVASELLEQFASPSYAIVTGNTEQRYIRVVFMRDYDQMFQVVIENDLRGFAGGGVGVLNQILQKLPNDINLVRAANYIVTKNKSWERGRIELIGHWRNLPDMSVADKSKYMSDELQRTLANAELTDAEGKAHHTALTIVDFASPRALYPRVFVSYSSTRADNKLQSLLSKLLAHSFEPVMTGDLGAGSSFDDSAASSADDAPHARIAGCVAFIGLQVRREDYKVTVSTTGETRYVLPPWATADEAVARLTQVPLIMRLKDAALEEHDTGVTTKYFRSDDDYETAVESILKELTSFRDSRNFARVLADARARQFNPDNLTSD